ncbi:MAG: hypothetical protein Q8O06_07480 [Acetobacterium sp.]|nr:hypothetical protein [Acetobacterium sp.]
MQRYFHFKNIFAIDPDNKRLPTKRPCRFAGRVFYRYPQHRITKNMTLHIKLLLISGATKLF